MTARKKNAYEEDDPASEYVLSVQRRPATTMQTLVTSSSRAGSAVPLITPTPAPKFRDSEEVIAVLTAESSPSDDGDSETERMLQNLLHSDDPTDDDYQPPRGRRFGGAPLSQ